ncbi:hypothetical protein [Staphylococcus phage vB_SauM-V1SA22]|nr:hypothetical protein [Staphylococcus phage vB_SauM-V1SA22]
MKIKREVSFIELMYMYYKGDIKKGQHYSTDSQFIVVITVDDISFYNALYPNKSITITIPNDTKFIVEAVIDASTELSSIVVTYKQGNSVLNSVWYRNSINEVIDYYVEGKNTWLLSVSTVVDNELVTIWKDGNVL